MEVVNGPPATGGRAELKGLLADQNWEGLRSWFRRVRSPLRLLLPLLHDEDLLIQHRAVEALGLLAAQKAPADLDYLRILIRRLLWTMNDESGNYVRMAPQAIGEILANARPLIGEFRSALFAFIDEDPFRRGLHWACARIAEIEPEALEKYSDRLAQSLGDPDPFVRAYALLALKHIHGTRFLPEIRELSEDRTEIELYDLRTGNLRRITVGEIAAQVVVAAS